MLAAVFTCSHEQHVGACSEALQRLPESHDAADLRAIQDSARLEVAPSAAVDLKTRISALLRLQWLRLQPYS